MAASVWHAELTEIQAAVSKRNLMDECGHRPSLTLIASLLRDF
jgi:hypothetical protein